MVNYCCIGEWYSAMLYYGGDGIRKVLLLLMNIFKHFGIVGR